MCSYKEGIINLFDGVKRGRWTNELNLSIHSLTKVIVLDRNKWRENIHVVDLI